MHISYFFTIFARPMHRKYYILYLLLVCAFTACVPCSVREVQSVVAQADRLWQAGQMYGDSTQLAQAYGTLGQWQWFYADEYAHACYHYGKLLRAKEDPVSAMQAFINATHSRTRDYHILGRVYNNIGDICHLAGDYQLSYDMFERSANTFLNDKDTLSYYYCLNDMAFELAEQGKKEETLTLLSDIESHCTDNDILAKVWETRVVMYEKINQQDSVIQYTSQLLDKQFYSPTVLLNRAKAYSFKGVKDSAIYYATIVLTLTDELYDKNNAMYILTNDDVNKNSEDIKEMASNRADIQKLIEDKRSATAQAAQLLKQELNKKPNWSWLYAIIATIVVISVGIGVYVYRKQRYRELLSQKVEELKQSASAIQQKQDQLQTSYQTNRRCMEEDIKRQCVLFREKENLTKDLAWNDFEVMTKIADKHFYKLVSKLRNLHVLNETEIRLCLLVLLDMNRAEISDTLPYSLSGVGKLKDHAAKSLGTTGKNLRQYLINLAIDG